MTEYKMQEYTEAMQKIEAFKTENGRNPNYVTMPDGKRVYEKDYTESKQNVLKFVDDNNRCPGTVEMKTTDAPVTPSNPTNSDCAYSPRYLQDVNMRQDTNWYCALNALQQVYYELYNIIISEKEAAAYAGTTLKGTSHEGIIAAAKKIDAKLGVKTDIVFVNWSSKSYDEIKAIIADPNKSCFVHDKYKETWGHYEYIAGLCSASRKVLIPNSLSGGYMETRSLDRLEREISLISQPSLCIATKG